MKMTLFGCSLLVSTTLLFAAPPADTSRLPAPVQERLREWKGVGKVETVQTHQSGGQTVYEIDFKERGENKTVWIGADGRVIKEESAGGPGNKGKGKAKGHSKNKQNDDDDGDKADTERTGTPAVTAPSTAPQPVPSSTTPKPAPPAPAPRTEPAVTTPQTAPPASVPQPGPSVGSKPGEPAKTPAPAPAVTKEAARATSKRFNNSAERINSMDNNRQAFAAGLNSVQQETGVALATLETQRKTHDLNLFSLLAVNELAKGTGKPVPDLVKEKRKAGTWEKVAAAHQVDLNPLVTKMERVEASMKAAMQQKKK